MGATKIVGILLLVAGLLGLFYGHFEYTKETHEGQFGPFRFSVAEKETAVIPSWASIAVLTAGVVLLVIGRKYPRAAIPGVVHRGWRSTGFSDASLHIQQ